MKLGGSEPKKVAVLVGLVAVAGIVYWMNSSDSPQSSAPARSAADPAAPVMVPPSSAASRVALRRQASGHPELGGVEFAPPKYVDPATTDPTLRLDLLAKVQAVEPEGGARNIFMAGTPPPDPVPVDEKGHPIPKVPKIDPTKPTLASTAAHTPPKPAAPAGPAPITLKYYGYSTQVADGEKKAFFLDGDQIIVAAEGEIIKKQYKVLRITNNSVQMEDTASKTTQMVPLQPDAAPV